ncbi:hypothetical protein KR222_002830 [Zaprionus bogoriensis]|nr:hypothetical protein KR222_002830 [Zaprionus bogoriensis]
MQRAEAQQYTASIYAYQVWYLQLLGAWRAPLGATRRQRWQHELRFYLILGIVSVMLLFFAIRVLANMGQMSVILQVFFMFATEVSCMLKLLSIRLRQQQHAALIDLVHADAFVPASACEAHIFASSAQLTLKLRDCYALMSLLAAALILLTQWFVDSSALPLAMYEPCDLAASGCYAGLYLYHVLSLLPTCWLNIAFDSLVVALLYFLRAQLDMLQLRLQRVGAIPTPHDDDDDGFIGAQLRDCCVYYGRIVELRDLIAGCIKLPCSMQLLCSVLVLISNFYVMSINTGATMVVIKTAMYQLVMLMQIFIICYAADEVTQQSSLLCHAIYQADWTGWSRANRRLCLLMMLRFDQPLHMHTLNHTQSFSLTTFSSIVNCSYSYFALLKRVNS